jgi:hypothetical protein
MYHLYVTMISVPVYAGTFSNYNDALEFAFRIGFKFEILGEFDNETN